MKICKNCGGRVEEEDEDEDLCEDCGFIRLKKFINELYEKQVKEENKNKR